MSFFYPTRWQNPYHPRYHNSSMYGLGAMSDQYMQQQAGAHNFTAEQQAIAAEIDFFLKNPEVATSAAIKAHNKQISQAASDFLFEWNRQAQKAYSGILNINPMMGGPQGENTGYDVIHGMYDKISSYLDNMTDSDEAALNEIYATVMAKYPQKPLKSANIFGLLDNFADLTDAYHDVYFSENPAVQKKAVRRFGWGKYLLWGGLALGGVLLIAGAMKARR